MSNKKVLGYEVRELSQQETDARRLFAVTNPEIVKATTVFAELFDQKYADTLFSRFLDNLKYSIVDKPPDKPFMCPCTYRKKFNPSYVCFGIRCDKYQI